jgi:5-methylcytosine-specific restriction endonuclease McrA
MAKTGFSINATKGVALMIDYATYISSPEWHAKATDAKRRAGWECALNPEHRGHLEVHHRTYARLGHERPTDLIVLCEECHRRYHGTLLSAGLHAGCQQPWLPFAAYLPQGADLN